MTYVPTTVPITPEMRNALREARTEYTVTALSVICGVNIKILYNIMNGTQQRVNAQLGARIKDLPRLIRSREITQMVQSRIKKNPDRSAMSYEQFHRQCNAPEFVAALRTCCINYRDIELKIKDIRETMK